MDNEPIGFGYYTPHSRTPCGCVVINMLTFGYSAVNATAFKVKSLVGGVSHRKCLARERAAALNGAEKLVLSHSVKQKTDLSGSSRQRNYRCLAVYVVKLKRMRGGI